MYRFSQSRSPLLCPHGTNSIVIHSQIEYKYEFLNVPAPWMFVKKE
jgi:hypothetical protein